MATVLITGAGASIPAGYPTAQELLPRMKQEASTSGSLQFREAWERWEAFLNALPAALEVIRSCSNPEVILSLPDLFDAAARIEDESRTLRAIHHFADTGESTHEQLQAYFDSDGRQTASDARAARAHLVECLDWFFSFRHHDDSQQARSARDYLRTHLNRLSCGDAVITFNWDTVAERALAEDGRWSPADGYGFPRRLVLHSGDPVRRSASEILVLKLHGSYGWRSLNDRFFLDGAEYLAGFSLSLQDVPTPFRDADEPTHYSPSDLVLIYPSFLKHLAGPMLSQVWKVASAYLGHATFVEIIGYSLPASDSAARALLLPLSLRLDSGATRVVVHDPCPRTLERWEAFLGPKAELCQRAL